MKKLLFSLYLCVVSLATLMGQTRNMPKVTGVTFGDTYSECKQVLDVKFNGGETSYQLEANRLTYYNVTFGGTCFDYCDFYFQNDGKRTYLYSVLFSISYELNESKAAMNRRDNLCCIYVEKYNLRWSGTNKDGYKYFVFGQDPFNSDDGLIVISTHKEKTKAGKMKIWTEVSYGPVNFIKPTDEI